MANLKGPCKNGWEADGPLIDVLVELHLAVKLGPRPGDAGEVRRIRSDDALSHTREAHRLLDAARLKAIEEESEHV